MGNMHISFQVVVISKQTDFQLDVCGVFQNQWILNISYEIIKSIVMIEHLGKSSQPNIGESLDIVPAGHDPSSSYQFWDTYKNVFQANYS